MGKFVLCILLLLSIAHASKIKSLNGTITFDANNDGVYEAVLNTSGLGINVSNSNDIDQALEVSGNVLFAGNLNLNNELVLNELSSAPQTPVSSGILYVKTDGNLYYKNDSGSETNLLTGGTSFSTISIADTIEHTGDTDTKIDFASNNTIEFLANNKRGFRVSNGSVEVNPDKQAIRFTVKGDGDDSLLVCNDETDRVGIKTDDPGYDLEVNGSAAKSGGGTWDSASDQRIKEKIKGIDNATEKMMQLNIVKYKFKKEWRDKAGLTDKIHYGVTAQNFEDVFPEDVRLTNDCITEDGHYIKVSPHNVNEEELVKAINVSSALMVHIKATQEQQVMIEKLKEQIKSLKKELREFKRSHKKNKK